jgi:hypothetical protein
LKVPTSQKLRYDASFAKAVINLGTKNLRVHLSQQCQLKLRSALTLTKASRSIVNHEVESSAALS